MDHLAAALQMDPQARIHLFMDIYIEREREIPKLPSPIGTVYNPSPHTLPPTKRNKTKQELREQNMYKEGERTHFGQELVRWNVPRAWADLKVC